MGFLKDLDDIAGAVTAPVATVARGLKKGLEDALDSVDIHKRCKKCGNEYSQKFENCPLCDRR